MTKTKGQVDPHAPTTEDGFRPRKFRPEGWKEQALADGTIADPDVPREEVEYGSDVVVFRPPAASLKGDAVDPQ